MTGGGITLSGIFQENMQSILRIILIGKEAGVYPSLAGNDLWVHQVFIHICLCYLKHAFGQRDTTQVLGATYTSDTNDGLDLNYFPENFWGK